MNVNWSEATLLFSIIGFLVLLTLWIEHRKKLET